MRVFFFEKLPTLPVLTISIRSELTLVADAPVNSEVNLPIPYIDRDGYFSLNLLNTLTLVLSPF